MRIAVTGHRDLPAETERLVDDAIRAELRNHPTAELGGISCLADGADVIFVRAILDAGGELHVVVPAHQYRDGLPAEHHAIYDELLAQAASVDRLEHVQSDEQAHMDGSRRMLDRADALLAVWDGQPARGYGGTADVVELARQLGMPVTVIWPDGSARE